MEAVSVIKLLPENRAEMKNFVTKIIDEVENGNINPLQLDVQMKRIQELCEAIREKTRTLVLDEVAKYEKVFNLHGATISLTERASYDYSNDTECVRLEKDLKARKEMLKAIKMPLVDEATGEVLNPPIIKKSDILTIKIL